MTGSDVAVLVRPMYKSPPGEREREPSAVPVVCFIFPSCLFATWELEVLVRVCAGPLSCLIYKRRFRMDNSAHSPTLPCRICAVCYCERGPTEYPHTHTGRVAAVA